MKGAAYIEREISSLLEDRRRIFCEELWGDGRESLEEIKAD